MGIPKKFTLCRRKEQSSPPKGPTHRVRGHPWMHMLAGCARDAKASGRWSAPGPERAKRPRNSSMVPRWHFTHHPNQELNACDQVCANRLTDPCFPQPSSIDALSFELTAKDIIIRPPNLEPNVCSTAVSETATVLPRSLWTKMGTSKWTDVTRNSWTSKSEGLVRHEMTAQLL
jgi:hypothetical protein